MENYIMLEHVGEGSFGKVYKARRKNTGIPVAMKLIQKHGKSEKDIKNLRQEIGILRTLNHDNIILMFDAFETERDFVVVTEFAQGELFDILQDDKRLPERTIQQIAKQLVKALHYLHSNRIMHRDMKPQNILIGSNGRIKLCDFGFARSMSNNTLVLTSINGTPLYMSPELVKEQSYDASSDLWSLGVILYELYVGTPPFYTNSIYSLISHIVKDPVKYPPELSRDFKSFLQGLLQKNPNKRLKWPALLDHPFVREVESDKEKQRLEKLLYLNCGGFGGPRERFVNMMLGSAKMDLYTTQRLKEVAPIGTMILPHQQMLRERHEKLRSEHHYREQQVHDVCEKRLQAYYCAVIDEQTKADNLEESKQNHFHQKKEQMNLTHSSNYNISSIEEKDEEEENEKREIKKNSLILRQQHQPDNDYIDESAISQSVDFGDRDDGTSRSWTSNENRALQMDPTMRLNFSNLSNTNTTNRAKTAPTGGTNGLVDEGDTNNIIPAHRFSLPSNQMLPSDPPPLVVQQNNLVMHHTEKKEFSLEYSQNFEDNSSQLAHVGQETVSHSDHSIQIVHGVERDSLMNNEVSSEEVQETADCDESTFDHCSYYSLLNYWQQDIDTSPTALTHYWRRDSFISFKQNFEGLLTWLMNADQMKGQEQLAEIMAATCQAMSLAVNLCINARSMLLEFSKKRDNLELVSTTLAYLALFNDLSATIHQVVSLFSTESTFTATKSDPQKPLSMTLCLLFAIGLLPIRDELEDYPSDIQQIFHFRDEVNSEPLLDIAQLMLTYRLYPTDRGDSLHDADRDSLFFLTISDRWNNAAVFLHHLLREEWNEEIRLVLLEKLLSFILPAGKSGPSLHFYQMLIAQQYPSALCDLLPLLSYKETDAASVDCISCLLGILTGKPFWIEEKDKIWQVSDACVSCGSLVHSIVHKLLPSASRNTSRSEIVTYNRLQCLLSRWMNLLNTSVVTPIPHQVEMTTCLLYQIIIYGNSSLLAYQYSASIKLAAATATFHQQSRQHQHETNIVQIIAKRMTSASVTLPSHHATEILHIEAIILLPLIVAKVFSSDQLREITINILIPLLSKSVSGVDNVAAGNMIIGCCLLDTLLQRLQLATTGEEEYEKEMATDHGNLQRSSRLLSAKESQDLEHSIHRAIASMKIVSVWIDRLHPHLNSYVDFLQSVLPRWWSKDGLLSGYGLLDGLLGALIKIWRRSLEYRRPELAYRMMMIMCDLFDHYNNSNDLSSISAVSLEYIHEGCAVACSTITSALQQRVNPSSNEQQRHQQQQQKHALQVLLHRLATTLFFERQKNFLAYLNQATSPTFMRNNVTIMDTLCEHSQFLPLHHLYKQNNGNSGSSWQGRMIGHYVTCIHHCTIWITSSSASVLHTGGGLLKEDSALLLDSFFNENVIDHLISLATNFPSWISPKYMSLLISSLSEIVLSSTKFLQKFVDVNGLLALNKLPLAIFSPERFNELVNSLAPVDHSVLLPYHTDALIAALQISSQLARNNEEYYHSLEQIFTADCLANILLHNSPIVRSKGCNLIGNLCRHSDRFYPVLQQTISHDRIILRGRYLGQNLQRNDLHGDITCRIVDILARRCADDDSTTRKFASFAVGNASFHSNTLYPYLIACIGPLSDALVDHTDEKTRANSAGAIGNLVRSDGQLSSTIAAFPVVDRLLAMVVTEKDIATQRIALFSLGTMAIYSCNRQKMLHCLQPSVEEVVVHVNQLATKDEVLTKYSSRLKQKLKQQVIV